MERQPIRLICAGLVCGILITAHSNAQNVFFDFNSGDTFSANFSNHFDPGPTGPQVGAAGDMTWQPAGGISDNNGQPGGGIFSGPNAGFDESAIFKTHSFDLTTGIVTTISMFVKDPIGTNPNSRPLQLGFINGSDLTFNGNPGTSFLSIRIKDDNFVQFQAAVNGTTSTGGDFSLNFTPGSWLKLTFSLAMPNPANGTIIYSFLVEDYGPNGTSLAPTPIANSGPQSFTNAAFAGTALSSYYAGFRTNSIQQPGFDNFAVTVPEPMSVALIGFGGLTLINRRRRAVRGV